MVFRYGCSTFNRVTTVDNGVDAEEIGVDVPLGEVKLAVL